MVERDAPSRAPSGVGLTGTGTPRLWQRQESVASHSVIDQAVGVVIAMGGLRPGQGIHVLTAIARHTGIELRTVTEHLVAWAACEPPADCLRTALETALTATGSSARDHTLPQGGGTTHG
ncbi:ANTAR domain-containing protein [Streptomyces monashensis]|uniref:ANTAR domain-containing protein n=1 Tax=Streptomyces monashensis TaxID=1678012 RepID=UPI0009A11CE7